VDLAGIDVQEERPRRGEHPPGLEQARGEEAEVVLVAVVEPVARQHGRAVAPALEPDALARGIAHGAQAGPLLHPAGVEGRIDVDQVRHAVRQAAQHLEVLSQHDSVHGPG